MSEALNQRIRDLEYRNKVLESATQQWDHQQKVYLESHSRLQQSESVLNEIKTRMERALTAGDLAWWDWEYKTGAIYFNPERGRLLGYSIEELPKNFNEVIKGIHPDDHDEAVRRIRMHIEGETEYYEAEYRLQAKSGTWKWFYDRGKVVEKDIMGNPVLISGVLIDVNDRKMAEKELTEARDLADAASKAKSLFLANMSHEIYTPLAGVVGMADILKQSDLSLEQREYIDIIVNSASNLMSVLNDIMEFIKVENKKIELTTTALAITQLMQDVVNGILERCTEKGLELLTYVDTQIPDHVMGDPRRLRQLLQIFVNNALKFTDEGRIIIAVEFAGWDRETIRIRFRLTDTGIGIPADELGRLFHSFTRVNTKVGKYGGSGLGLAIAKHLVELMNGEITVESKEGVGSTFAFTVEFDRLVEQESFLDSSTFQGKRFLLVDPDPVRRTIIKDYLLVWDCEVEERDSVPEASELLNHQIIAQRPFDLTIIEYSALEGSSDLFVRQFQESVWIQSPHILVTSRNTGIPSEVIKKSGFTAVLFRPFLPEQLLDALQSHMPGDKTSFRVLGDSHFQEVTGSARKVLRILLVEDNLINQRVALVTLKKLGHDTTLAENGQQAVELYEPGKFDLILMDILMPKMDGLEATRKIREIEEEHQSESVHICAITANIHQEDEDACYDAGMNSYITKPFKLEELNAVLSQV